MGGLLIPQTTCIDIPTDILYNDWILVEQHSTTFQIPPHNMCGGVVVDGESEGGIIEEDRSMQKE